MTTAIDDRTASSTISAEAYDLIQCFYDGLDELVYELAKEAARAQQAPSLEAGEPVQIEVEDVRLAIGSFLALHGWSRGRL